MKYIIIVFCQMKICQLFSFLSLMMFSSSEYQSILVKNVCVCVCFYEWYNDSQICVRMRKKNVSVSLTHE